MSEEEEHKHLPGTKPVTAYQPMGVNVRAFGWFVVCFVLSMGVILVVLWWIEKPFIRGDYGQSRPLGKLDVEQPIQPSPGHEQLPWEDLIAMRQQQESALNAYGAPAGNPAHVHIPISRAMDLLLQSGDLSKSWRPPTTLPYKMETKPSPYTTPTVRNRT